MQKKRRPKGPVPGSSKFARAVACSSSMSSYVVKKTPSSSLSSDLVVVSPMVESSGALLSSPALNPIPQSSISDSTPLESAVSVEAQGLLPKLPVRASGSSFPEPSAAFEYPSVATSSSPGSSAAAKDELPLKSSKNVSLGKAAETTPAAIPWAQKFKSSLRNLKQMDPPTFLEDGTPVVVAPTSVLLKTAEMWKGHIVAQFHGLCPPPSRIFTDLNPIWGRFGSITVRMISETAALIFIPSLATREWALDIGFWQAGNCSCTVYPWSPAGLLEVEDLQSAPTWAILKNIPPQLYSLDGISVIASGIGEPLHTERSRLDPINIGATKVKVVIQLDSTLPSTVVVKDVQGNTARVAVEYPRPPPKCLNCGRYGHLLSRCPKPLLRKTPFKKDLPGGSKEVVHPTISLPPLSIPAPKSVTPLPGVEAVVPLKPKRRRSRSSRRSKSNPPRDKEPLDKGRDMEASLSHQAKTEASEKDESTAGLRIPVKKSTSGVLAESGVTGQAEPEVETEARIESSGTTFPYPPGWEEMSAKAKKKQQKIWYNQARSAGHSAFVLVRGVSSDKEASY